MAVPTLRRAHTTAPSAVGTGGTVGTTAPPVLYRSRSAPRRPDRSTPALCLEVPWESCPSSLPCPHSLQGLEVICLELQKRLSDPEILRTQFLCFRAKFAAPLLGFSRRSAAAKAEAADSGTRLFYAKPWQTLNTSSLSFPQRLHVAHGAATALWNLHSLGVTFGRWEDGVGLAADGKVELLGVAIRAGDPLEISEDLQGLALLLLRLLSGGNQELEDALWIACSGEESKQRLDVLLAQDDQLSDHTEVCRLLADLAVELLRAEAGSHEKTLQATVTSLARLMRDHEVEADPVAGPANAKRAKRPDCGRGGGRAWTLLRHVLRACWALQRGLEALCCVCLEASPKSLGLLCARPHGLYQLLCGDCLEPYVCSLIGTAELRRYEGGILCPACACADGEGTIFSRPEVQAKLAGTALRRFVEATDPVSAADPEEETGEDEWAVLVEDLVSRSVRLVTHARASENDEPREVRKSKDVLPHTWLLCDGQADYIQYDPQQMRLRQHMSPRLFQLQVAECLTMHCPKCHCPLDPDPDGCVAMSCLACNEGFCWVCFTCCGDDAHQHALEIHGGYFPGQDFVQAWHRKLRWERVQLILRQLLEESQNDALEGSKGLLKDLNLWPFPSESPDVPDCSEQVLNVHGEPWGPINLHLAARLGRMQELQEALEEEDVNLQDERGMTALCYASHEGRMEAIRFLMDRAADPNLADFHGVTPLHYACREPPFNIQDDVAGFLLSYPQVDANQRDDSGASAILVAAEVGRHQVMRSLLACERLDPNLTNFAGRTALLVACGFDHTEVVMQLLRSERVHVTLRGQHGETPLHMAALRGGVEVLQLLLAHPQMELNVVNDLGRSALHEAASLGAHQVVRCLLSANVLVDQRDKKGCSPLMLAAMNGSFEAFEALLPLSQHLVNDRDSEGFTVLMRLAARGATKGLMAHACLQLLRMESGVDIDAQNAEGSTALMLAIGNGCVPSAEDLLAWGASTTPHDLRGETAWTLASRCRPAAFRHFRSLLPREEPAAGAPLLFDGLLVLPVERANRTLLAGGALELSNPTMLTVEFESRTLQKWKEAGYMLFQRETFYQQHEDCTHELEIQRVNGQIFVNQELLNDDSIKLRSCKHVRRLTDWQKDGWFFSTDGRKLCHVGARKTAAPVLEEQASEFEIAQVALEEFLDMFSG